ncbi:hypothetical protein LZ554_006363 [Drepanopeziza brunnea f. sp. 'monogermtubi']|nr:hypothetical protein LZ554_006363 [Drepanopeziza brunnea f. sp. 'monogermtubi']
MLVINAFLAAATFAVATSHVVEKRVGRKGNLKLCHERLFGNCAEIPYGQDGCMSLYGNDIDQGTTSFDTYNFGCEFYGSTKCETDQGYFVYRGAIDDLLTSEFASLNDAIRSFRCGT